MKRQILKGEYDLSKLYTDYQEKRALQERITQRLSQEIGLSGEIKTARRTRIATSVDTLSQNGMYLQDHYDRYGIQGKHTR
jgi:hypothetical protein